MLGLPSAYAIALAVMAARQQRELHRLVNLAGAGLIALVIALPWYLANLAFLRSDATEFNAVAAQIRGDPPVASLASLLWYLWNLVNNELFLVPALFFLLGLVMLFRHRDALRANLYPLLSIAGTYVAFSLLAQRDPRYTLPLLPGVAVIATYWIGRQPGARARWAQWALLAYCAIAYLAVSFGTPLLPQELIHQSSGFAAGQQH